MVIGVYVPKTSCSKCGSLFRFCNRKSAKFSLLLCGCKTAKGKYKRTNIRTSSVIPSNFFVEFL